MNRLHQALKSVSIQNFVHLSLNQGVNVVVALVITPYLFQTLGEEQYGLIILSLTIILLFGILVNYGFNLNIPKALALLKNDHKAKEVIINEVIITRLLISLTVVVLVLLGTHYLGLFAGYSVIIIYSLVQLVNDALFPMFILQGLDRLSWISKANAIAKLMYLGLVVLVVKTEADAKWVNFLLGSTGVGVHAILLFRIYMTESIRLRWVGFERIRLRIEENFQFFSSTVASYILINGGFILLKNFVSEAELGFYALAQRVSLILRMVPVFIAQSILQNATRLYEKDREEFEAYLRKSYKNGLLLTFVVGLCFALGSKWVVRVLAGEFIPLSASLMSILCFLPFLGMFNVTNIVRILVMDQKHILAKAGWITTLLMLVLGSIGGYYYGSFGLAWALVISDIFNFWVHRYFIWKQQALSTH